jgi:hypothetical protein
LKLRTKVCPALNLTKGGHKVIFASRAMLSNVFERESASVFSAIRAGILA